MGGKKATNERAKKKRTQTFGARAWLIPAPSIIKYDGFLAEFLDCSSAVVQWKKKKKKERIARGGSDA